MQKHHFSSTPRADETSRSLRTDFLGILELTSYGVSATQDSISGGVSIVFTFPGTDLQTGKATAFFVNLPHAVIEDAEIYILPDPKTARWYANGGNNSPSPIDADIEGETGSIYKVTPKSIPADATGFLCLWVKMPQGISDRLYAIKLSR